jgi:hypothetical protein
MQGIRETEIARRGNGNRREEESAGMNADKHR